MPGKKGSGGGAAASSEEYSASEEENSSEEELDEAEVEGEALEEESLTATAHFMKSSRSVSAGFYVDIFTDGREIRSLTIKGRAPGPFGSETEGDHSFALGALERMFSRSLRKVATGADDYLLDVTKRRRHLYDVMTAIGVTLDDI